jgi:hypothetical protein
MKSNHHINVYEDFDTITPLYSVYDLNETTKHRISTQINRYLAKVQYNQNDEIDTKDHEIYIE